MEDLLRYTVSRDQWRVHMAAATPARKAGACWQCAAEVGCRATDTPDTKRRRVELHSECERRIAKAKREAA